LEPKARIRAGRRAFCGKEGKSPDLGKEIIEMRELIISLLS
jgi:hypothetical protein